MGSVLNCEINSLAVQDIRSILYFDEEQQKTICPVKDGQAGVGIANFIPKLVIHLGKLYL